MEKHSKPREKILYEHYNAGKENAGKEKPGNTK
jgi:hypothetical protein